MYVALRVGRPHLVAAAPTAAWAIHRAPLPTEYKGPRFGGAEQRIAGVHDRPR